MPENKNVIFKIRDLSLVIFDTHGNRSQRIGYGDLDICEGDFIIIKGRNGVGKSTLFHLLSLTDTGYFGIESGSVVYNADGFPDTGINEYGDALAAALRRDIVYIGQEERFLSYHSAYDALCFSAETAVREKYTKSERLERLSVIHSLAREYFEGYLGESLKCKDIKEFKKRKVTSFSGGQMKLLSCFAGIIKATVCESKLIIMDEPLNNLDGKNKYYLNKLVSRLLNGNAAILIITHCQIFDGINRVITLTENENGEISAKLQNTSVPPHADCLEPFVTD